MGSHVVVMRKEGRTKEEGQSKNETGPLALRRSHLLGISISDVSEKSRFPKQKKFVSPPNGREFKYKRPTRLGERQSALARSRSGFADRQNAARSPNIN